MLPPLFKDGTILTSDRLIGGTWPPKVFDLEESGQGNHPHARKLSTVTKLLKNHPCQGSGLPPPPNGYPLASFASQFVMSITQSR